MYRIILLLCALLVSQSSLGQETINMGGGLQGEYGFMGGDTSVKGSKYYFNDWGLGRILFTDGKSTNNGLLQVDLELDQLLVNNGPDRSKGVIVDIDKVEKFTIAEFHDEKVGPFSATFVKKDPKDFDSPGQAPRYYRQVTQDSDHVLEEISKYLFDHSQDNTSNYNKKNYKEYRIKTAFHIKDAHGIYQRSNSLNERAFSKAYPDIKKELKDFVRRGNIDFGNAEHLDRLVSFCIGHTGG